MRRLVRAALGLIGFSVLGLACAGGDKEDESFDSVGDPIGSYQQPLCENKAGTNAVMTALAVASGRELGRWLPERDFQWNSSTGMLELSANAAPRCRTQSPSGLCQNLQALLDMQTPAANGKVKFAGNITLDSNELKAQLKANWNAQVSCNSSGACTVQNHDLKYTHVEAGSCDKKFFFNPLVMGTSTQMSATEADKLKNKLKFLGYPSNKMLNFYMRDGQVSVDPTYGLNDDGATTTGSCDGACTKFSGANVAGKCCSCNGVTKIFQKAAWNANTFLCL